MTIHVDNQTGGATSVTVAGGLVSGPCAAGTASYRSSGSCAAGQTDCVTVTGLTPGIWKHQISVGAQNQYTKSLVIAADANGVPNVVLWTAFRTVLSVDRTDDVAANPTPVCPSAPGTHTCTLRQAMSAGATAAAPLLVEFDPTTFPAGIPVAVQLTQSRNLPLAGYQMTVDGTDADGNPSFGGDPYNRVVTLPASGATFVFSNQGSRLIGLSIQRPTLSDGATPEDMIRFDGGSGHTQQNVVEHCRVDGGGGNLTLKSSGHDCVAGFGGAGMDWSTANVVQSSEISGCPDKGVKATTLAYVRVQDSWVHHNIGGGIQATLSGNIEADRNVIERNGYNASVQVFADANALSANGANAVLVPTSPDTPSVLRTDGNLLRNNSARGISVQELSTATIANDFACGAVNSGGGGQNGIAIFNSTSSAAFARVRGTTAIYNGRNGATVGNQSDADFGLDALDRGNNAFTQNATNPSLGGHNFDNSVTPQANVPAAGNQWQHCYADPTNPAATCDGTLALDIDGAAAGTLPQPYRAAVDSLPISIERLVPGKGTAGDLVRIIGTGFNAVDPYPPGGDCLTTVEQHNTCTPLAGNCVQYEAVPGQWLDLPVQAVTPTQITVRLPPTLTCVQPLSVRVQRLDYTGAIVTGTATFCTSS